MKGDKAKKIRALAAKHPKWTYRQIADAVGCDLSRVSQVLKSAGREQSAFAYAYWARAAGFTVPMLKSIAARTERRA